MPLTLVATVGSGSANTYSTLAEANTYHESHLYATAWDDATDDDKNRALVMATRLLDDTYQWYGWPVDSIQSLGWPRAGVLYRSGYSIPSDIIPQALKDATAELARLIIERQEPINAQDDTIGLSSLRVGSIALAFDGKKQFLPTIPDAVRSMIDFLGASKPKNATSVPLVRY